MATLVWRSRNTTESRRQAALSNRAPLDRQYRDAFKSWRRPVTQLMMGRGPCDLLRLIPMDRSIQNLASTIDLIALWCRNCDGIISTEISRLCL
jgi:hypothetical protein